MIMGEEGRAVPKIDLQELPFQYTKLREACREWGCFRVVNHSVPVTLMSEMKRVVRSLLDLPIETKHRNKEVSPGSGYIAPGKLGSIYESLCISDLTSPEAVCTFCSLLDASPEHRKVIEMYIQAVWALAINIADKMAKSLGLSTSSNLFAEWPGRMRMNKYSFTPETVGNCGVLLHTDSSFLSLLQDDDVMGGLEVVDEKSGSFVAVQPCPGTFFVNVGDFAVAWSNGRFSSVKHRVQCLDGRVRVSIGMFMFTPWDVAIESPEELVDSENPRRYVLFTCEDYIKLRKDKKMHTKEALSLLLAHP